MSQLALARRYRPQNFQAVIGQEATLRALKAALDTKHLHHAYLFTGTRGVGKTTLARILAKCLNCEQGISSNPCGICGPCQAIQSGAFVDVVEVDAASRTKVEDTRELLDNVQYLPTCGRFKIYLIDEVHMLSSHSFNALLKTLEEPPDHVKFLLATTDPQKLPVTVLSRCLQFHLRRLPFTQIVTQLKTILTEEKILFEIEALEILARSAEGSMRDALSLLDQAIAYMHGGNQSAGLIANDVRQLLGLTEKGRLLNLLAAVAKGQAQVALQELAVMADSLPDFVMVLVEFLSLLHHIAIAQQVPDAIDESVPERNAILDFAKMLSREEVQLFYQIALLGQKDLPYAPTPQMGFEMVILRMLAFQPVPVMDKMDPSLEKASETQRASIKANTQANTVERLEATKKTIGTTQGFSEQATSSSVIPVPKKETLELSVASQKADTIAQSSVEPVAHGEHQPHPWLEILPELNLVGMTKELAYHCSVLEWADHHIHLVLEDSRKPLLNKRHEERLQEALCQYLMKTIHLKITIGERKHDTLAMQHERHQDLAQKKAHERVTTDPNVLKLMDQFDAKIEEITITEDQS